MKTENKRAFKEWAVSCRAMLDGRQTLLIRKGGIREEGGVFVVNDPEFFLMPTYEHQNAGLLRPEFVGDLESLTPPAGDVVTLSGYAVVEVIEQARDEEQVLSVIDECIWNAEYVRQRFDFNPYDPLYLLILRVYRLPEPVTLPMLQEYVGCKSWVTLDRFVSLDGAEPAIAAPQFEARRDAILERLSRGYATIPEDSMQRVL